jgi:hypothetical protein
MGTLHNTVGLDHSRSNGQSHTRQLVPDMKSELIRVCRSEHESMLNNLASDIDRISGQQQIDVSGHSSEATATVARNSLMIKPWGFEGGNETMCNNQTPGNFALITRRDSSSPKTLLQDPRSGVISSAFCPTCQRPLSSSTVTGPLFGQNMENNWLEPMSFNEDLGAVGLFKYPRFDASQWPQLDAQILNTDSSWNYYAAPPGLDIDGWDDSMGGGLYSHETTKSC